MKNQIYKTVTIIDYEWYSGRDSVGIILCEDNITKERSVYVGICPLEKKNAMDAIRGINEEENVKYIVDWGTKMSLDYFKQQINNF